jgi:hypothetical protein
MKKKSQSKHKPDRITQLRRLCAKRDIDPGPRIKRQKNGPARDEAERVEIARLEALLAASGDRESFTTPPFKGGKKPLKIGSPPPAPTKPEPKPAASRGKAAPAAKPRSWAERYRAEQDPVRKGEIYAEHRNAIVRGFDVSSRRARGLEKPIRGRTQPRGPGRDLPGSPQPSYFPVNSEPSAETKGLTMETIQELKTSADVAVDIQHHSAARGTTRRRRENGRGIPWA